MTERTLNMVRRFFGLTPEEAMKQFNVLRPDVKEELYRHYNSRDRHYIVQYLILG